ncbi:hypothetical protein ACJX0J_027147, partial [Zea mays]
YPTSLDVFTPLRLLIALNKGGSMRQDLENMLIQHYLPWLDALHASTLDLSCNMIGTSKDRERARHVKPNFVRPKKHLYLYQTKQLHDQDKMMYWKRSLHTTWGAYPGVSYTQLTL